MVSSITNRGSSPVVSHQTLVDERRDPVEDV